MPRAFNEHEEVKIRHLLRSTGKQMFSRYGVLKTSIEEITGPAGIAKGSFYKFYPSKEALFFELLEEAQNELRYPLVEGAPKQSARTRKRLEGEMRQMLSKIQSEPLLSFLANTAELQVVARKVSMEVLSKHQAEDKKFIKSVIDLWNQKPKKPHQDMIAAHFSMLLLMQHNDVVLGERLYPHAQRALITSFTNCFFLDG